MHPTRWLPAVVTLILVFAGCGKGDMEPADAGPPPYFAKVRTIVAENCLSCHSSSGIWTGRPVELSTDDQIVLYAQSIKSAVADPPAFMNARMPEDHPLTDVQVAIIVRWAMAGGRKTD